MRTCYRLPLLLALLLLAAGALTARPARAQQYDSARQGVTLDFDALLAARNAEVVGREHSTGRAAMNTPVDGLLLQQDPEMANGIFVIQVTDTEDNGDGSMTAHIEVHNSTTLWYKLYVTPIVDVDLEWTPAPLEDSGGMYLLLPPEGSSSFAYPSLSPSVTFNEAGGALYFYADRTVESGVEALILQNVEILNRAFGFPTLPHDAGAMLDLLDAPPFVEAAQALSNGNVVGVASALAALARSDLARAQLVDAFAAIGKEITEEQIKNAAGYWDILTSIYHTTYFIGELFGYSNFEGARVVAIGPEVEVAAQISMENGDSQSAPSQITFDASGSYATNGIASYEWSFEDGTTATGETVTHTFYQPGSHMVELTVTDTEGNQDSVTRSAYVYVPQVRVVPQTLLTSQFETENSPYVTGYTWDFGDGQTASGRVVEHTYEEAGEYTVTLTLSTDDGGTTETQRLIWALLQITGRTSSAITPSTRS